MRCQGMMRFGQTSQVTPPHTVPFSYLCSRHGRWLSARYAPFNSFAGHQCCSLCASAVQLIAPCRAAVHLLACHSACCALGMLSAIQQTTLSAYQYYATCHMPFSSLCSRHAQCHPTNRALCISVLCNVSHAIQLAMLSACSVPSSLSCALQVCVLQLVTCHSACCAQDILSAIQPAVLRT
eukprot:1137049-Pelagomonas_calceolata.AAC.4